MSEEVNKYHQDYSAKDAMTDPMDGRKKKKRKLPFAKKLQNMIFDEVSLVGTGLCIKVGRCRDGTYC